MSRFDFSVQQDSENNTGGGDHLPSRLKEHDQWLVTHDKPWDNDWHKRPKYPTSWNDGGDLLSFEDAYDHYKLMDNTGIALRFTDHGPFIGFDFDKVRRDGDFTKEALDLVQHLNSYTEVSSSEQGLHVIAEGDHLNDRKNKGQLSDCGELEVYDTDRYFVITGDVYNGFTSVKSRLTAVREVQDNYLPERQKFSFTDQQKPVSEQEFDGGQTDATPKQVRQTIRAYIKTDSKDVDGEVISLWRGSNEGRPSASEADMAFVKQLYYWCKGDQQLIDKCFRASGRMRPKWDKQRGDQTYGEMTIRKVCQSNNEIFRGRYVNI